MKRIELIAAVLVLTVLCGCGDPMEIKEPKKKSVITPDPREAEMIELKAKKEAAEKEKELAEKKAAEEKAAAEQAATEQAEKKRIAAEERQKERDRYLEIQQDAIGSEFSEIELRGRTYTAASIKAIDDEGVRISHADGAFKIEWAEIPRNYKSLWGFDPNTADELNKDANVATAADSEDGTTTSSSSSADPGSAAVAKAERRKQEQIQREQEEKEEEAARKIRLRKIADLQSKITQARSEIGRLERTRRELQQQYSNEDFNRYARKKGVATSQALRDQNLNKIDGSIQFYERIISKGESEVNMLERLHQ